jgi:ferrous iron transport protein B
MGAIHREMVSARWTFIAIAYQCLFAYAVAYTVYQVGMIVTGAGFTIATVIAFLLIAGFIFLLFRPPSKQKASGGPALNNSTASV